MAITPSRFSPISLTAICAVCRLSSMGFIPNTSRCIRSFSRAVFRCLKMFFSSSLFSMPCAFSRSPRIMFTMSFLSFLVKNSFSAISFLYVKGISACWRLPLMNLSFKCPALACLPCFSMRAGVYAYRLIMPLHGNFSWSAGVHCYANLHIFPDIFGCSFK